VRFLEEAGALPKCSVLASLAFSSSTLERPHYIWIINMSMQGGIEDSTADIHAHNATVHLRKSTRSLSKHFRDEAAEELLIPLSTHHPSPLAIVIAAILVTISILSHREDGLPIQTFPRHGRHRLLRHWRR